VGGDPTNRIDPSGLDWCGADDLFCFIPFGGLDLGGVIFGLPDWGTFGVQLAVDIGAQIQASLANEAAAFPSQLGSLQQSGVIASYQQAGDALNVTLSNSGFLNLAQSYFAVSYTAATAGTIAIGGQTIGWSVTGLGQFILTGVNVFAGFVLAQALEQPAGGKDEICFEQYEADKAVCKALGSAACYDQAMQRYAACLAGKPIPPFPYSAPGRSGRRPR